MGDIPAVVSVVEIPLVQKCDIEAPSINGIHGILTEQVESIQAPKSAETNVSGDDGEASDETSSRHDSCSSADGSDRRESCSSNDGDVPQNNEDQDKNNTNKVLNIPHNTTKRKKKKRRSTKTHGRTFSRSSSLPAIMHLETTYMTSTEAPISPTSISIELPLNYNEDIKSNENGNNNNVINETITTNTDDSTSTKTTTTTTALTDELSHIPSHLVELTPPPTRGRSNAFYAAKTPPLIHSHSDLGTVYQHLQVPLPSSSISSPRKNMGIVLTQTIPEPRHSGISKPKMFNYWRTLTGNQVDKSVISHSKRFLVGFADTIGRRPTMEDCMVVHGAYRGRGHEDYFALFDGHGGKDAAIFCAEHLHQILADKLKTNNAVKSLKEAFVDTNKMISDQKIIGGTTALVVLFIGKKGFIANVGDTRAVLCRDGVPLRVSLDHKPELPTESSRIKKLGGTVTTTYNSAGQATSRVNGMLAVSRALGDTPLHPYVSSEPEIHGPLNLDTESRNQFVVVACDGVWDVMTDEEATSIVAPIANPEMASRRLRDEAFARGSTDNISVMVIRCPPFQPCD